MIVLKSTITNTKISLDKFKGRFGIAVESISEFKKRAIKISYLKNREKNEEK